MTAIAARIHGTHTFTDITVQAERRGDTVHTRSRTLQYRLSGAETRYTHVHGHYSTGRAARTHGTHTFTDITVQAELHALIRSAPEVSDMSSIPRDKDRNMQSAGK